MPRATYSALLEHNSETAFRAWGKQLSDALKACLTQTADTGQVDWVPAAYWSDDFTRANAAVGSPWVVSQGTAAVDTNTLRVSGTPNGGLALRPGPATLNGSAGILTATIVNAGAAKPQLVFRGNAAGTTCYAWSPVDNTIYRYTSLTARTAIVATGGAFTPAPGDVLEIEFFEGAASVSFIARRNGVAVVALTAIDNVLPASSTAIYHGVRTDSDATGATFDNISFSASLKPQNPGAFTQYEIYRFSDALQATKPVFIKVEYGTGTNHVRPQIKITVSDGSNGLGALTGSMFFTTNSSTGSTPAVVPVTTWVCYKDGTFALAWGLKANATAPALICLLERARDEAGVATSEGLFFLTAAGVSAAAPTVSQWSYINSAAFLGSAASCLTPQNTNSALGSLVNVYNWFCWTPNLKNVAGLFTYKNGEIPAWTEVDVAILGTTPRHYVCLGNQFVINASAPARAEDVLALLWEV